MRCAACFLALVLIPAHVLADDAKPLSAEEAAKKVGEKVTLEFEVKSTGQSGTKRIFLNSEMNHRSEKNFTIVIDSTAEEKFTKAGVDPKGFYKGKVIRVTGTVSLFQNKPEIKVDDPAQIKVIEKK